MNIETILKQAEVLAVERRPEACIGCGFEHSCSTHGCAVIKALIEQARAEKDNAPLTFEQLRGMDGEPVWLKDGRCFIVDCRSDTAFDQHGLNSGLDILADIGMFRHKPEHLL